MNLEFVSQFETLYSVQACPREITCQIQNLNDHARLKTTTPINNGSKI